MVKNPHANAGNVRDVGSVPGLGRSSGGGHGKPLQYSCLENPMDGGAWKATVHGVAKSWTRLSDFNFTFTFTKYCISTCGMKNLSTLCSQHILNLN